MTNKEFVKVLRDIADVFEQAPALPPPLNLSVSCFSHHSDSEVVKRDVKGFVEGVRSATKQDDGEYIQLVAAGFPEEVQFSLFVRKKLLGCRKVKRERTVIEEKWECGPVLDSIPDANAAS